MRVVSSSMNFCKIDMRKSKSQKTEAQAEEIKASNKELQAINVKLRSATEELETGEEELPSVNEELTTLNDELKIKIEELARSNADFQNLMNSTNIGTIFLDREFRVKMFTPPAKEIFNFIKTDIGRELSDITHRLAGENLMPEIESVLSDLKSIEREVRTTDGKIYLMQITPYRAAEDRIGGAVVAFVNITSRKQTEEDLRLSEERFSAIVKQTTAGMTQIDLQGKILLVNERFCEITGCSAAELLEMRLHDLTHPEDLPTSAKLFEKTATMGKPFVIEMRFVRPDDSIVWVHVTISAILDAQGKPQSILAVALDLTARMQMETDLQASEKYRSLFDSIDEGFCIVEMLFDAAGKPRDYRFLEFNPMFGKLTGLENAIGKRALELVPDLEKFWVETYGRVALTGEAVRFENHSEQMNRWFDVYASRIGDEASRKVAIVFTNITERKLSEQNLRESEERLRLIINSVEDYAIITTDTKGIINGWNPGAEKMFGYAESEIIGRNCEILFTPEDRAQGVPAAEMQAAIERGSVEDERIHVRKDGSRFFFSGVIQPLKDSAIKGFVKIARDMTERIEAEQTMRQKEMLQKMIGAQEDERRRIARDLHDELGQLLVALRLKLEAVRKSCETNQELRARVDDSQTLAKRIDDGLDFLAWELRPAALDDLGLRAALEKYVREWTHYAGITATLLGSGYKKERLAPEVETNLYRIAQEALNNAYKHSDAKTVEIVLEKRGADTIVLIVEDDGKGFNPKTKMTRGKGIGLIGMTERAALIGGSLAIESAPGKGTTVHVRVPIKTETTK